MQAQLNRIKNSADTLHDRGYVGSYRRLRRAASIVEERTGNKVYRNGDDLAVITKNNANRVENAVTTKGRMNAIQRAANGGSAG